MLFITELQENSVKNNHRVVYAMHGKTAVVGDTSKSYDELRGVRSPTSLRSRGSGNPVKPNLRISAKEALKRKLRTFFIATF